MRIMAGVIGVALVTAACGQGSAETAAEPAAPGAPAAEAAPARQRSVPSETREFRDWRATCDNGNACFAFGFAPDYDTGWVRIHMPAGPEAEPEIAFGLWTENFPTTGAPVLMIDGRSFRLRRGERPASSVPAAPPLPDLTPAPAVDQAGFGDDKQTLPASLRALPAVQTCLGESEHSEWLVQNVMSARLDARTELWAVPCGAGAYNISHHWYLTGSGGRDPRPAVLLGSGGPRSGEEAEVWPDNATINGGYAPNARTITAFSKGRGIGDCGTSQTWLWTGRQFELQTEDSMGHCAGVPWDYWPTTWRTR